MRVQHNSSPCGWAAHPSEGLQVPRIPSAFKGSLWLHNVPFLQEHSRVSLRKGPECEFCGSASAQLSASWDFLAGEHQSVKNAGSVRVQSSLSICQSLVSESVSFPKPGLGPLHLPAPHPTCHFVLLCPKSVNMRLFRPQPCPVCLEMCGFPHAPRSGVGALCQGGPQLFLQPLCAWICILFIYPINHRKTSGFRASLRVTALL